VIQIKAMGQKWQTQPKACGVFLWQLTEFYKFSSIYDSHNFQADIWQQQKIGISGSTVARESTTAS